MEVMQTARATGKILVDVFGSEVAVNKPIEENGLGIKWVVRVGDISLDSTNRHWKNSMAIQVGHASTFVDNNSSNLIALLGPTHNSGTGWCEHSYALESDLSFGNEHAHISGRGQLVKRGDWQLEVILDRNKRAIEKHQTKITIFECRVNF